MQQNFLDTHFSLESFQVGLLSIQKINEFSAEHNLSFGNENIVLRSFIASNREGLPDDVVYGDPSNEADTFVARSIEWVKKKIEEFNKWVANILSRKKDMESQAKDVEAKVDTTAKEVEEKYLAIHDKTPRLTLMLPVSVIGTKESVNLQDSTAFLKGHATSAVKEIRTALTEVLSTAKGLDKDIPEPAMNRVLSGTRKVFEGHAPVKRVAVDNGIGPDTLNKEVKDAGFKLYQECRKMDQDIVDLYVEVQEQLEGLDESKIKGGGEEFNTFIENFNKLSNKNKLLLRMSSAISDVGVKLSSYYIQLGVNVA